MRSAFGWHPCHFFCKKAQIPHATSALSTPCHTQHNYYITKIRVCKVLFIPFLQILSFLQKIIVKFLQIAYWKINLFVIYYRWRKEGTLQWQVKLQLQKRQTKFAERPEKEKKHGGVTHSWYKKTDREKSGLGSAQASRKIRLWAKQCKRKQTVSSSEKKRCVWGWKLVAKKAD